jgi:hypothetical protein
MGGMTGTGKSDKYVRLKSVLENPKILSKYIAVLDMIARTYDSDDVFRHESHETFQEDLRFYKVENLRIILRNPKNKECTFRLDEFLDLLHIPPQPKSRAKESPLEEKTADED